MHGLTAAEHRLVHRARLAVAKSLEADGAPPELLLPLVAYVNRHLEPAGLRLSPIRSASR